MAALLAGPIAFLTTAIGTMVSFAGPIPSSISSVCCCIIIIAILAFIFGKKKGTTTYDFKYGGGSLIGGLVDTLSESSIGSISPPFN